MAIIAIFAIAPNVDVLGHIVKTDVDDSLGFHTYVLEDEESNLNHFLIRASDISVP